MTTITAPPIQYGRVIGRGDVLVVERQGSGSHSVINAGGRLDVLAGGAADHTRDFVSGVERVEAIA